MRSLLAFLPVAVLVAGCGSGGTEAVVGSTACALVVDFQGHAYLGNSVGIAPIEGVPLGSGTLPSCHDTGSDAEPDEDVEVSEVEGVAASVAIAWKGRGDVVLIREDVDLHRLPPALARLLVAPSCDPRDEPIELGARLLGILGAEGETEVDLVPPYDLTIHVGKSSPARYERAFLTVRVPPGLGRPLHSADLSSLWDGGTLALTVTCRDGGYVAEHVESQPA